MTKWLISASLRRPIALLFLVRPCLLSNLRFCPYVVRIHVLVFYAGQASPGIDDALGAVGGFGVVKDFGVLLWVMSSWLTMLWMVRKISASALALVSVELPEASGVNA